MKHLVTVLLFLGAHLIAAQTVVEQTLHDKLTPAISAKINQYGGGREIQRII